MLNPSTAVTFLIHCVWIIDKSSNTVLLKNMEGYLRCNNATSIYVAVPADTKSKICTQLPFQINMQRSSISFLIKLIRSFTHSHKKITFNTNSNEILSWLSANEIWSLSIKLGIQVNTYKPEWWCHDSNKGHPNLETCLWFLELRSIENMPSKYSPCIVKHTLERQFLNKTLSIDYWMKERLRNYRLSEASIPCYIRISGGGRRSRWWPRVGNNCKKNQRKDPEQIRSPLQLQHRLFALVYNGELLSNGHCKLRTCK